MKICSFHFVGIGAGLAGVQLWSLFCSAPVLGVFCFSFLVSQSISTIRWERRDHIRSCCMGVGLFIHILILICDRRVIRADVLLAEAEIKLAIRHTTAARSCFQQLFWGFSCSCCETTRPPPPSCRESGESGGRRLRLRPCHRLCVITSFSCAPAPRGAGSLPCHRVQTAVFLPGEDGCDSDVLIRQEEAAT